KVYRSIASRFRANYGTAPGKAFASNNSGELVPKSFVHPEQKPNFASAHADVSGRHIGIGADMAKQLAHEGLAKPHHFAVALSFRVEIRTAFAATHRQSG